MVSVEVPIQPTDVLVALAVFLLLVLLWLFDPFGDFFGCFSSLSNKYGRHALVDDFLKKATHKHCNSNIFFCVKNFTCQSKPKRYLKFYCDCYKIVLKDDLPVFGSEISYS